jgi:acyl-coenzyme A thioesterase PaaI-like protein
VSSKRQGILPRIAIPAGVLRRGLNLWPPFAGAGIRVTRIAADFREIDVRLRLGVLNRNYFGTQFGGSLYAMADPMFALMMLHNLGPEYVVWDKAGCIRYLKPARGDVFARFRLPAAAVARARRATAHGAKHEPAFRVRIVDRDDAVVAEVGKTLYIRRRPTAPAIPARRPLRARPGEARAAQGLESVAWPSKPTA